jgi:AcrR family transcriptional regulator
MTQTAPDRRGAMSRAALMSSARKLFAERGFHGTSVGDIADAAGLRKPSLFHHFPTKEALYRAVMDELIGQVGAAILGGAHATGTYPERLDAVNDTLSDFFASHQESARLLFREALEPGAVMGEHGVTSSISVLEAAAAFLAEGMKAGDFAQQDPKQLVLSLTGLHLTFFAIAPLASPFVGASVFGEGAAPRKAAVRAQARALVLKR